MRVIILNNEVLNFEIETILEERGFNVSHEVVSKAMTPAVSLEVGGKVRVTFAADTDTVNCVGTAEYWQGGELTHMFIDSVRGSNDAGVLPEFVKKAIQLPAVLVLANGRQVSIGSSHTS